MALSPHRSHMRVTVLLIRHFKSASRFEGGSCKKQLKPSGRDQYNCTKINECVSHHSVPIIMTMYVIQIMEKERLGSCSKAYHIVAFVKPGGGNIVSVCFSDDVTANSQFCSEESYSFCLI